MRKIPLCLPYFTEKASCSLCKSSAGLPNENDGVIIGTHRNSICEWIAVYHPEGIEGLLQVNYGTDTSILESNASCIKEQFLACPPRSIADGVIKVKGFTRIMRSLTWLKAFVKKHQFRFFKTGHIPAKLSSPQQLKWVNETLKPVIKAA